MNDHAIKKAIILAAGRGERINSATGNLNKSLLKLGPGTIIDYICSCLETAHIEEIFIITGYSRQNLKSHFLKNPLKSARVRFIHNDIWEKGNGTSLWAARDEFTNKDEPFFVLMSDHIFDPEALFRLIKVQKERTESLLCTDASFDPDIDLDDATKVFIDSDGLIRHIDKKLTDYNAIDCGIFCFYKQIFDGLKISIDKEEYSLSGGVRYLVDKGNFRSVDISRVPWQDIDTETDLKAAEKKLLRINGENKMNLKPRLTLKEVKEKCRRKADYPITQFIINPIVNRLVWYLQDSKITPNQITLISLAMGMLAGGCFIIGSNPWLKGGAFLVFASHVLDCMDGDLARVRDCSSQFGAVLDPITDRIIEFFLFLGASVGLWRQTNSASILIWGFWAFGSVLIYYYIVDAWYRRQLKDDRGRDFLLTVKNSIKLGLYEFILYGFVFFALINRIEYILYLSAILGTAGTIFQTLRLRKYCHKIYTNYQKLNESQNS